MPALNIIKPSEPSGNASSRSVVRSHQIAQAIYKLLVEDKLFLRPNLTREMLTQNAHLSKSVLSGVFKREYGCSIPEYTNSLRLNEALRLIEIGSLEVNDVAFMSGFSNVRTFNRIFHEKFQMSPSAYRKRLNLNKKKKG